MSENASSGKPKEEQISSEDIVGMFNQVIEEVRKENPNALGAIVYGSRTRGTNHPGSDLDYVPVYANGDHDAYQLLWGRLNAEIKNRVHIEPDSHFRFPIPWELVLKAEKNSGLRSTLRISYSVLDKSSIIFLPSPEMAAKFRDIFGLDERVSVKLPYKK